MKHIEYVRFDDKRIKQEKFCMRVYKIKKIMKNIQR
jgi:hypothetical protein